MRHILLVSAAPILLGLAITPADARGGSGAAGGGGHGGFGGGHAGFGFRAPGLRVGVNRSVFSQQRFVHNRLMIRNHLNADRFSGRRFSQISGRRFSQNAVPLTDGWVGGIPWGWGWSDGGWGWPAQVAAPKPVEPQVIVIRADPSAPSGRQFAEQAPQDYSYVPGCRAIANGYHCDTQ